MFAVVIGISDAYISAQIKFLFHRLYRELVEELHPLMKEALERRPEVC